VPEPRLWSQVLPPSLWWVQYLNSVCDWSKFVRAFSLVNQWAAVNRWKDSHKFRPITNRVQMLNSPKWGWMLVWPEPPRRVFTSITAGSGTQDNITTEVRVKSIKSWQQTSIFQTGKTFDYSVYINWFGIVDVHHGQIIQTTFSCSITQICLERP
jgi:hypothetical protein